MKIDPRHLAQISAIVEGGGVTEGAALLGATQPALSRTLAMLERRLGEPLFVRGRRPLQPTPLGRALAEHGAAIRQAAARAATAADAFRQGEGGAVRVGGTPFFMDALISGMIAEFQAGRPGVRIDQSYGYTEELAQALLAGRLDLAICPVELLEPGADLAFTRLLPGRNVVAAREDHPLARARPLRPRALLDFPWIEPPPGSPLNADLRQTLLGLGAERIRVSYAGGSLFGILNYLRKSDALAVLPHSVVFALRGGGVTALALRLDHPPRELGLLRSRLPGRLPAAERLAEHVAARFAALADLIRRHEEAVVWRRG